MKCAGIALLMLIMFAGCRHTTDAAWPSTVPEQTAWRATARHEEVLAFARQIAARDPRVNLISLGATVEGRDIAAILCADPPLHSLETAAKDPRSKVLVLGSIHPGECEGKEAILETLRALAGGEHTEWLRELVVVFVPDYNADGTDAVQAKSREQQAGPSDGCGRRETSTGLDLNRDFTKSEAPETRALLRVITGLDPLLTIDCHTTNGSYHGYHLTYAGPLSPASDPELLRYVRKNLLLAVQGALSARGMLSFDYGNWRGNWWPDEPPRVWETYDHLPRYVTNGIGLRNRLSLLSEAYVHRPFPERIAATRALIAGALDHVAAHRDEIARLCAAADARATALAGTGAIPLDGMLTNSGPTPIPSSSVVERVDPLTGRKELHHSNQLTWVLSDTSVHFEGLQPVGVPWGFAVPSPPAEVLALLERQGIRHETLRVAATADATELLVSNLERARSAFQGHRLVRLRGTERRMQANLPLGTLIIPCAQPLARLAVLLCDPRSPDGFVAWGAIAAQNSDGITTVPILRLIGPPILRDKED